MLLTKNKLSAPLISSSKRVFGITSPSQLAKSRNLQVKPLIPRAKLKSEQIQDISRYATPKAEGLKELNIEQLQGYIDKIKATSRKVFKTQVDDEISLTNKIAAPKSNFTIKAEKELKDNFHVDTFLPDNPEEVNTISDTIDKITKIGYDVNDIKIRMTDTANNQIFSKYPAYGLSIPYTDTTYLRKNAKEFKNIPPKNYAPILKHELGHVLHNKNDEDLFAYVSKCKFTEDGAKEAAKVSSYAATAPAEFVAETFRAMVDKKPLDDKVVDVYKKFGGAFPKSEKL